MIRSAAILGIVLVLAAMPVCAQEISALPSTGRSRVQADVTPTPKPPVRIYIRTGTFSGLPMTSPAMLTAREDVTEVRNDDCTAVLEQDGRVLGSKTNGDLCLQIYEFPNFGSNCLTHVGSGYNSISFWNGADWQFLRQQYDWPLHLNLQTRTLFSSPAERETVWVMLMGRTETDEIGIRRQTAGDTPMRKVLPGAAVEATDGLKLVFWEHPGAGLALQFQNVETESRRVVWHPKYCVLNAKCEDATVATPPVSLGANPATIVGEDCMWTVGPGNVVDVSIPYASFEPRQGGDYVVTIRYEYLRGAGLPGDIWSGSLESNPVRLRRESWIPAVETERLGKDAPKVRFKYEYAVTSEGESGKWRYRTGPVAGAGRSSKMEGVVTYDGIIVRGQNIGQRMETPFGTLKWCGKDRYRVMRYSNGWMPILPPTPFASLSEAVKFIVNCLDQDDYETLSDACVGRANPSAVYLAQHRKPFDMLKAAQKTQYLLVRYAKQDFPKTEDTFKLGGHMSEIGCLHVDFVKKDGGWFLADIWDCR